MDLFLKAYQDLYDNTGGMMDDLAAFWSAAAKEFRDVPGIIGYELINEPFAGDFYSDPELLLPGVAGSKNLQRMSVQRLCMTPRPTHPRQGPSSVHLTRDPALVITLPPVHRPSALTARYNTLNTAIRKNDDRHIIFYEPVTWGMIFDGKIVGSGFTEVPGGTEFQNRSALSYHYYCDTFVPEYGKEPRLRKVSHREI